MSPLLLALALGTAPELWVATQGFESAACDSDALANAIRSQRAGVTVRSWHPERETAQVPPAAIRVQLAARDGVTVLEVSGPGRALTRPLPTADGCVQNVATAALIVDIALDDLGGPDRTPAVQARTAPVPVRAPAGASEDAHVERATLGATVGLGFAQGPLGLTTAIGAGAMSRYRI